LAVYEFTLFNIQKTVDWKDMAAESRNLGYQKDQITFSITYSFLCAVSSGLYCESAK
jgi:hypothetical protein